MKNALQNRMMEKSARQRRGFTLVELAIVLSVAGLMFVGLWRLLASGNQQVRDQTAASQQEQLIASTKAYLASSTGQAVLAALGPNGTANIPLPAAGVCAAGNFCNYLPSGFINMTANSYGQTYTIQALKDGSLAGTQPNTYSFMVVTFGGDAIPDTSGGRISAFIGGDGGFIYSSNVCNAAFASWACGSYGTWSVSATAAGAAGGYGYAGTSAGHVASRTYVSPTSDNTLPWLERNTTLPDTKFSLNTMTTDLFMGGTSGQGTATASNIYLYPPAGSSAIGSGTVGSINLGAPGGAPGGGIINMDGGSITGPGSVSMTAVAGAGIPLVTLSGAADQAQNVVRATNGCTISYNSATGFTYAPAATCNGGNSSYSIFTDNLQASFLYSLGLYAQTFIYTGSDIRLKRDIHPIAGALDDVMKLKPVSYTYKSNGMPSMGVIAQDLEKVYPQLVSRQMDGMESVNYNGLIGPLIGAVQDLKKENDALRLELDAQKKREDRLEQQIRDSGSK